MTIKASYKNARGQPRTQSFVLHIEEYRDLSSAGRPAEYEIADTLKKLAESVQSALSGYVKVATTTEKELQDRFGSRARNTKPSES